MAAVCLSFCKDDSHQRVIVANYSRTLHICSLANTLNLIEYNVITLSGGLPF